MSGICSIGWYTVDPAHLATFRTYAESYGTTYGAQTEVRTFDPDSAWPKPGEPVPPPIPAGQVLVAARFCGEDGMSQPAKAVDLLTRTVRGLIATPYEASATS